MNLDDRSWLSLVVLANILDGRGPPERETAKPSTSPIREEVYYPDDPTPDGWRYPVNLGRPAEGSGSPR